MKAIGALALLAALLAVTGCGSAKKVGSTAETATAPLSGTITIAGTTIVSNVRPGTVLTCNGGRPTATVPDWPAQFASVSGPNEAGGDLELKRSEDGVVTASCTG